jgi:hypothetical protein
METLTRSFPVSGDLPVLRASSASDPPAAGAGAAAPRKSAIPLLPPLRAGDLTLIVVPLLVGFVFLAGDTEGMGLMPPLFVALAMVGDCKGDDVVVSCADTRVVGFALPLPLPPPLGDFKVDVFVVAGDFVDLDIVLSQGGAAAFVFVSCSCSCSTSKSSSLYPSASSPSLSAAMVWFAPGSGVCVGE